MVQHIEPNIKFVYESVKSCYSAIVLQIIARLYLIEAYKD